MKQIIILISIILVSCSTGIKNYLPVNNYINNTRTRDNLVEKWKNKNPVFDSIFLIKEPLGLDYLKENLNWTIKQDKFNIAPNTKWKDSTFKFTLSPIEKDFLINQIEQKKNSQFEEWKKNQIVSKNLIHVNNNNFFFLDKEYNPNAIKKRLFAYKISKPIYSEDKQLAFFGVFLYFNTNTIIENKIIIMKKIKNNWVNIGEVFNNKSIYD